MHLSSLSSLSAALFALGLGVAAGASTGCTADTAPTSGQGSGVNGSGGAGGSTGGDAGTVSCNGATCAAGELCCESADESCTLSCTKTIACPRYGRPCKILDAGGGGAADGGGGGTTDAGGLTWWETCGAPVCMAPADGGTFPDPKGSCAAPGTACTQEGKTCDDGSLSCQAKYMCAKSDPKVMCPRSKASFKDGIHYVDAAEEARLRDDLMKVKLASYTYKPEFGDPTVKHLGFLIDDMPKSPAVLQDRDRVDLYGYLSMVVAASQAQEREIAALKAEVARLSAKQASH